MRFISVCAALAAALLICTACAPMPADPLAYQREAASLCLVGKLEDADGVLLFSALLDLPAAAEEAPLDLRDFTLTYTSPVTLAGLTLTCSGGEVRLTRGKVAVTAVDGRYDAMLAPATLFCIDAPLAGAQVTEQNGATLNRVETADDEGSYVLYLTADGWPSRIEAVLGERQLAVDISPKKE